jgi:hypothetical protein
MPDGAAKTSAALELFGRSGGGMVKILNQGSDGIKDLEKEASNLGLTLSTKNIADVSKYIESQKKLKDSTNSIKIAVGELTAPVLTKFNTTLNDMILKLIAVDSPFRGVTADVLAFGGPILGAASGIAGFLGNVGSAIPVMQKFSEVLKLGAAFEAIQGGFALISGSTIPAFIAEVGVARAAWMSAFPVAGILADIGLVYEAVQSVLGAYKAMNDAKQAQANYDTSYNAAHARLQDLAKNGSSEQKANATKALKAGYASGTNSAVGGSVVVGEEGAEVVDLPRGSIVHDAKRSSRMQGGSTEQHFHGPFIFQTDEAVKGFFSMANQNAILAAKGFALQRPS